MIDWYCGCPAGSNGQPWAHAYCTRCGYLAPPQPVTPVPAVILTPDERARMLGLIEWLDAEIAKRPEATRDPMIATGISAILGSAKREPDARYAQLVDAGAAIDAVRAWVASAIPPDPEFLDRLIGPAKA